MILLKKALLVLLLSIAVTSSISAVSSTEAGIDAGDWMLYRLLGDYSVWDDLGLPILGLTNMSLLCYVNGVSGTVVSVNYTIYEDGQIHHSYTATYDLSTAETGGLDFHIVLPSLDIGEEIPLWNMTIVDATYRSYPSGYRFTNHARSSGVVPSLGNVTHDLYYDVTTGVLVEWTATIENNETRVCSYEIVDTNINEWVIPEFPSFLILPLFMISTLLAVMLYKREHSIKHMHLAV